MSIQDWCEIIVAIVAIGGPIAGIVRFLYKKYKIKTASIRANFFKSGKSSWCIRIYNSSQEEIEATNIRISFPKERGFFAQWNCEKDSCPSLKRHASFDISVCLYTSAPDFLDITMKWNQHGTNKEFTTTETISLR